MNDKIEHGVLEKKYIDKRKKFSTWKYRLIRRSYEVSTKILKFNYNQNVKILDLGCAESAMYEHLDRFLEDRMLDYTGVEYSFELLPEKSNLKLICADITKLPIKKSYKFDVVILSAVLEHITEPEKLLEDLAERLTESGIIVITMPDPFYEKIASKLKNIEETVYHNPLNVEKLEKIAELSNLKLVEYNKFMITPYGFIAETWIEKFIPGFLKLNQCFVLRIAD